MRKILAMVAGGAVLLAAQMASAQPACTTLTITGHPEYPPIGYRDGDTIAGAGALMLQEIGTRLGVAINPVYAGTWDKAQAATRTGAADVIFGIYYNDERATYLEYVRPPFTTDPVVVFVRSGAGFAFAGLEDLIGKHGVSNVGESFGVELDAFIAANLDVARVAGIATAFTELMAGRADYVIFGLYPGLAMANELGIANQVEVLAPALLEADMFVAFSKVSPCLPLLQAVGAEIEAMRVSGRIDELIAEANAAGTAIR